MYTKRYKFLLVFSAFLTESQALLSIKNSISDDPFSSLSDWNAAAVDLSSLNLTGTLSPHLAALPFLTNVFFHYNKLSGEIPPELASISSLRRLILSHNILNGSIPCEFSQLKNLLDLDVYDNKLGGDFPEVVTEIPNLRSLNLAGNYFAGRIPPAIGNLSELVRLDAVRCGLTGKIPPEMGNLRKLKDLFLYENALSGPLPEVGGLKSIELLDISNNMLVGLQHNLWGNTLNGSIPKGLLGLPNLTEIDLQHKINFLSGELPIADFVSVNPTQIRLSNNMLSSLTISREPSSLWSIFEALQRWGCQWQSKGLPFNSSLSPSSFWCISSCLIALTIALIFKEQGSFKDRDWFLGYAISKGCGVDDLCCELRVWTRGSAE